MFDNLGDQIYKTLVVDDRWQLFVTGIGNTFIIAGIAVLLGVLIGSMVAIAKVNFTGRRGFRIAGRLRYAAPDDISRCRQALRSDRHGTAPHSQSADRDARAADHFRTDQENSLSFLPPTDDTPTIHYNRRSAGCQIFLQKRAGCLW